MMTIYTLSPHITGGSPTAQPPQVFPSLEAVVAALDGEWKCTLVTEGIWELRRLGYLDLRVQALPLRSDGTGEFDAQVLEMAAGILLRRYGRLVAGDIIDALDNRAGAIREGLG
jgi:hypothetical protein